MNDPILKNLSLMCIIRHSIRYNPNHVRINAWCPCSYKVTSSTSVVSSPSPVHQPVSHHYCCCFFCALGPISLLKAK